MALLRAGRAQWRCRVTIWWRRLGNPSGSLASQVVVVMDRLLVHELTAVRGGSPRDGADPVAAGAAEPTLFSGRRSAETASLTPVWQPARRLSRRELGVYTLSHTALFLSRDRALGEAGQGREGRVRRGTIDTGLRAAARERAQATARSADCRRRWGDRRGDGLLHSPTACSPTGCGFGSVAVHRLRLPARRPAPGSTAESAASAAGPAFYT